MDFDLGDLAHLEETLYKTGYDDGFEHGRIHGLIEGRALGREKGFEMWEELGFYEGFAGTWLQAAKASASTDDRAVRHAEHLLALISKFPTTNPAADSRSEAEVDMVRLYTQIRSRYKALCSTIGVRPRLTSAGTIPSEPSMAELGDDPRASEQSMPTSNPRSLAF